MYFVLLGRCWSYKLMFFSNFLFLCQYQLETLPIQTFIIASYISKNSEFF